jgi:unsaturated rhamnogalacturonyl hydrolase
MKFFTVSALATLAICFFASCSQNPPAATVRIGIAGTSQQHNRVDVALERMAEPYLAVESISSESLAGIDLLILPRDAFAEDIAGVRSHNDLLTEWVKNGGCLLAFCISEQNYTSDLLPHEIRFATDDPSGWGLYDFSERIADTTHSIFNRPHRLRYLAGLEESSRIVHTAPGWTVLLGKNGEPPSADYKLIDPPNDVGSVFETTLGEGHVLVCQPIIDRHHAGNTAIVPHPLEGGVQLFENVVEYMKQCAADTELPIATLQAVPSHGAAGATISLHATLGSGKETTSCSWDFGDGVTSEEISAEHAFSQPGTYWVTAAVTSADGATDHAACRVVVGPARELRWADHIVDAFMHRYYPDPGLVKPNYRTSLVLHGLLDVYERSGDTEILEYVQGFFRTRLIERWDKRPYRGETEPSHDFVDLYSLMSSAWRVFNFTGDSTYLNMAREVWAQSLAIDHSLPQDLLWSPFGWGGRRAIVDFTYFKSQLRGVAWEDSGDKALLEESVTQLLRYADFFQDPSDSLYFMAIDMDHKAYFTSPERPSGLNDSKWCRADGWMALALTELMTRLDRKHPKWNELQGIIERFFTGLGHVQDPETGLWALVIDRRDYPGMWFETTGSSMYVYSICKLVEAGVLPREPYLEIARRGYNGIQQRLELGHWDYPYLSDACQGTLLWLDLDRWITSHRNDNDLHVLGPFLMAEEALWRVAPPDVAVIGNLKKPGNLAGQILNVAGVSFFSVPELYNAPELSLFRALVVERGALDSNTSNIAAYPQKLAEFAGQGGTLLVLEQENVGWLKKTFPGLGKALASSPDGGTVEAAHGDGRVIYCRSYPVLDNSMSENERVAVLKKFALPGKLLN